MALGIEFVVVRLQVGSDLSLQRRHQHPARPPRAISSSRELIRAVAETNLLEPKPDFVFFGGDLAQLGTKAELDHGAEIMSALRYETHYVMGEHDYYLDLGEYWSKLFDDQIDNITFHSVMATAWPWPYPQRATPRRSTSCPCSPCPSTGRTRSSSGTPRAGSSSTRPPAGCRCSTRSVYDNTARTVAFDARTGRPEDTTYQDPKRRFPPQAHF